MCKKISTAILSFFFLISFSSLARAAVTLTVENALGYPGSNESHVNVSLTNPDDKIRALTIDICDVDNYLTCTDCALSERDDNLCFTCSAYEQLNGCCRVVLYTTDPSELIEAGTSPTLSVNYTILDNAPVQSCRDLNLENAQVSNEFNQDVGATRLSGNLCFQRCANDGNCVDSAWCNGDETCNSATGICEDGTNACQLPTENFCEEFTAQCVSEPLQPIVLFAGNNTGLPNSQNTVDLILYNNPDIAVMGDEVVGVEMDVCDAGNYLSCFNFTPDCRATVSNATISCTELDNGCCHLIISRHIITEVSPMSPIGSISYSISDGAPLGESIPLNFENVRAFGYDNIELGVSAYPGSFCFSADPDNDDVSDCDDNCPVMFNPDQADADGDGIGNVCENMSAAIPTLSEWGAIIFMTILVGTGVVFILRRKLA